jgi:NAD dependent epimerase/dehydratase
MSISDKRVLVTGAGGFIGSHLVEALLQHGCQVRAMVHYNSRNSWGWLEGLTAKYPALEIFAGDVRDPNGVAEAMDRCQVVFHLAALIGIPFSYHSPDTYIDVNIKGTLNILQAARRLSVEKILVTSTSEVYGTAKYVPIDENHPLQGQSPYSASKIGADKIAESFYRSFNLPVVTVRPFNTYGPRQSARAIIPTLITQLLEGAREIKAGSLEPTRDFNYVLDTVAGYIALAESDKVLGREVNIATGEEHSVGKLARKLIELINPQAKIIEDEKRIRPEASEVFRLCGDNKLITSMTDWRPKYDFAGGLAATVDWFRDPQNRAGYKSQIYNV